MLLKHKLNARCCRAKAGVEVLIATIFSVALSACTPTNDSLVVIPIDPKPNTLLFANLVSGSQAYRFVFSTIAAATFVDADVAKRDMKQLTSAECAMQECADDPSSLPGTPPDYYWLPSLQAGQWKVPVGSVAAAVNYRQFSDYYGARFDGLLGLPAIATLNWLWNRSAGTMRGYSSDSRFFARERDNMVCTPMEMIAGGIPAIQLELSGQPAWFALDTSMGGSLSGELNRAQGVALRSSNSIAAEVMFSPKAPAGESWRHALLQLKSASLAGIQLDGLAFDETEGHSSLGLGFLYKLDKAAFDFANHRFCIPASTRVKPDRLPTQAELRRVAAASGKD